MANEKKNTGQGRPGAYDADVYRVVSFTKAEYAILVDFLERGISDLAGEVEDHPDTYDSEDHIEEVIEDGETLLDRLNNL